MTWLRSTFLSLANLFAFGVAPLMVRSAEVTFDWSVAVMCAVLVTDDVDCAEGRFCGSVSPISPTKATTSPTRAEDLAGESIFRRNPSDGALISALTFSVSMTASFSPFCTRSPSFFAQLMIVPLVIVSPSFGMRTVATISVGHLVRSDKRMRARRKREIARV